MLSVVDYARDDNHCMLSMLLAVPALVPEKLGAQSLLVTSREGFWQSAQVLLRAGVSPDTTDSNKNTCLQIAAGAGHAKVVEELLAAGSDVNATNCHGATPLHSAAVNGHTACVETLLSAGASQRMRQRQGCTPLLLAARNARRAAGVLARLAKNACGDSAVLDAQDDQGRTALHWASSLGLGVQVLLSAGASAKLQDIEGNTALMLAAVEGFDGVVANLAITQCHPDLPNQYGNYPLHFLAMKNHASAIRDLVHAGCDVNVLDRQGCTPLWYAVNHNRPEAVKALLKANCLVDPFNLSLEHDAITLPSPLQVALNKRLYGLARMLVLAGCEVTPLYSWLEAVLRTRSERLVERRATLWVEGRQADSDEEDEEDEEQEAEEWFNDWLHSPHSLRQLCRIAVRRCIGRHILRHAADLPLPPAMQDYVTLKEVEDHHVPGGLM